MTDIDAIRARDADTDWTMEAAADAIRDRHTLLAEVDRLTAAQDDPEWGDVAYAAGIRDERARIRAAVEGLPPHPFARTVPGAVDRATVLDLIDHALEEEE